jgi:transposase-like protein
LRRARAARSHADSLAATGGHSERNSAITTQGKPVFIGLDAAAGESDDAWDGFLHDLGERGLARPPLVISDARPG